MSSGAALTLHGETVRVGSRTWSAHLLGAQMFAGWRCIRVELHGVPTYTVLLKISPNTGNHEAVHALEWWLLSPGRENGDVIEVM
jgi:hypothetical protein